MISDPKVGDVVSLAPGAFHKHLTKDQRYVITSVDSTWGKFNVKLSLTTLETKRNKDGRKVHLGSYSGIWNSNLQRHDFLTAVYNAKKEKNAANVI